MVTLQAKTLSLEQVHQLLNFGRVVNFGRDRRQPFAELLAERLDLEPLKEAEQNELEKIQMDFWHHLNSGQALEAGANRLAGFYAPPIRIDFEQDLTTFCASSDALC